MLDLNSLIGLNLEEAKQILAKNNITEITITINSKHNDKTDTLIVCFARQNSSGVELICGEFFLNARRVDG